MTKQPTGLTRQAARALSERRQEPDWLLQLRLDAFDTYEATPLPDQRTEGWRRTSLAGLDLENQTPFPPRLGGGSVSPPLPLGEGGGEGRPASPITRAQLPADAARQGVVVMDLAQAVRDPALGPRVREHFGHVVRLGEDKLTALHYAYFNAGAVVYVPRGAAFQEPLRLAQQLELPGCAGFVHTLVIVEQDADVALLDEYRSLEREGSSLASGVVELVVGPNARVRYAQVQDWAPDLWSFSWQTARLDRDAHLRILNVVLGGRLSRNTVQVFLDGNGSQADLLGVVAGEGRQHADFQTLQDHWGSATRSDLVFHNALRDRSSSNFTGLIRIEKTSRQTESSQEQKNVLLSPRAKADSDPKLEILNNDVVRCTHGASVGPVDSELVFYLQSRGLDRDEAEQLIVEGFFQSVLEKLAAPELRDAVWAAIQRKLAPRESVQ